MGPTQIWGYVANSQKKLALEGSFGSELALLGYRIDLVVDTIALPGPKLFGGHNLAHLGVFTPCNYTIPLQTIRALRGSMGRWRCADRLWRWLVEPANQMIGKTDTAFLRMRRGDG